MRELLLASAVIVVVAVAAPNLFTRYMERSGAATVRPAAAEVVTEGHATDPSVRQFEVKAARDGHFYVDAEINFRRVRLMVDTGATVVALRQSDAAAAGLRLVPADFRYPVQTANGTAAAAQATLDSVAVDDIEVHNVRALVIPDAQLSISLLGGSFLHALDRFEVTDGRLVFEDGAGRLGFQPEPTPTPAPGPDENVFPK